MNRLKEMKETDLLIAIIFVLVIVLFGIELPLVLEWGLVVIPWLGMFVMTMPRRKSWYTGKAGGKVHMMDWLYMAAGLLVGTSFQLLFGLANPSRTIWYAEIITIGVIICAKILLQSKKDGELLPGLAAGLTAGAAATGDVNIALTAIAAQAFILEALKLRFS